MKTLYIIHGWTYTTKHWDKTLEILRKKGVKVKMLKVPGLTEPSSKVWTIDDYAKWADENIPDFAVALGHSNGGRILMNLLVDKPEKLGHLILLSSAGVFEPSRKRDFLRAISKLGAPLKQIKGFSKVYHKLVGASDYEHAPENMKKTLANMLDSDRRLNISAITTPTTILWGREDTVTPPRQAEAIHARIRGSKLELYDGWTHAPYISHPEELAEAILGVLKEIS